MNILYQLIDYFLLFLHVVVILINCFGWIFKATRKIQLYCLTLTTISWFFVGYFYGFGYCFLTDWHWQIKSLRGQTDLPNSFPKFLIDSMTNLSVSTETVNTIVILIYVFILLATLIVNINDIKKR